ncbi:hypothetical protein ABVN23_28805 [Pseudomonas fluorescens]|uniref:hypothetical protein n=1 Tax=Pseudomonas fluorescens TaxID=294 RepID=UPI003F968BCD
MKRSWVFLFWGVMDFFYMARFCYVSFSVGKIPMYSDVQSFLTLMREHDFVAVVFFCLGVILNLSIVLSMILFFRGSKSAPRLAFAQTPLRVLLAVPSLFFVVGLAKGGGATSVLFMIGLILFSESLKVSSILLRERLQLIFSS